MAVRGSVRAKRAQAESLAPPVSMVWICCSLCAHWTTANSYTQRMMDRRAELTTAFGTKKARDVIKNDALNKISTQKDTDKDPASKAVLETIGVSTVDMATREQLQAAVTGAKPVPPPNIEAEEIQDVYDPVALLGAEVLEMVPTADWS